MAPDAHNAATLARVLKGFGLGSSRRVRRLHAGTGSTAKFIIEAREHADDAAPDRLFLKRRPRTEQAIAEALAQHGVRAHLADAGLPVQRPIRTREGGTLLLGPDGAYELSPFVDAERWTPAPPRARAAGRTLRDLHDALEAVRGSTPDGLRLSTPFAEQEDDPDLLGFRADDGSEAGFLLGSRADAAARVRGRLPADNQIIHGDFHPGNTRWEGDRLVAVLDFDACRVGSALEEAALASVHFGLDRSARSMASRSPWPDPAIIEAFWEGYGGVRAGPDAARLTPWLAVGAFATEALRGMREGSFSDDTVAFASGVVAWIVDHADGLGEILARLSPPAEPG